MTRMPGQQEYDKIFFEISGTCQARCPHCCTGNRSLRQHPARFIPTAEFAAAVDRLLEIGLAGSCTQFELYNWGEPFLHPDIHGILKVLVDRSLYYRLSTNAGHYQFLPSSISCNMNELTVTIPGFSQESYDRVHGFSFSKILEHIGRYRDDFGSGKIRITYLIHQFNIDEIRQASEYFACRHIRLTPTVAYLNDYNLSRAYRTADIDNAVLTRMGRELLLWYVDDLLRQRPNDYLCPQYSILALDEYCNVLTCCQVPKGHVDYSLGSLFALSPEKIRTGKIVRQVCRECQKLAIDYWIHTSPAPAFWGHITGEGVRFVDGLRSLMRNAARQVAHLLLR